MYDSQCFYNMIIKTYMQLYNRGNIEQGYPDNIYHNFQSAEAYGSSYAWDVDILKYKKPAYTYKLIKLNYLKKQIMK